MNLKIQRTTRELIFIAVVLVFTLFLIFCVPSQNATLGTEEVLCRALVTDVDNTAVEQYGIVYQGDQIVQVDVLSGIKKSQSLKSYNALLGDPEIDFLYAPGDKVLLSLTTGASGKEFVQVVGTNRLNTILVLTLLFALVVIGVAGWTGVKALFSFVFTILMIWKVLIPCALHGISPILLSLGVVTLLTSVITLLVGGVNRKGLTAFLGGELGLLTACGLAMIMSRYFHLTGINRPFAKSLIFIQPELDVFGLFISGIFISASGAVMDLAMDIAVSMHEIHRHHPAISMQRLLRSGLKVGHTVIGTMTTTLLLAYSGGFIMMLMYFSVQKIPLLLMLNSTNVASEILITLVGSFGLVTVAPFSALIGSFLYCRK